MASSRPPHRPSTRPTGPPPNEEPKESTHTRATEPPTRRQTMEVQIAWLETKLEEKLVAEASAETLGDDEVGPPEEPLDDLAVPISRRRPPRLPGSARTRPPMPIAAEPETRPPPPPRRVTQEVEMSWVEIVDEDLTEDDIPELRETAEYPADEPLPDLRDDSDGKPEITRVEDAPLSSQRILAEREAARVAAEQAETDDAERAREEALAARARDQDARDREMRQRRKAEREQERLAQEAAKREQEKKDAAIREGRPQKQVLDLSGIDDEIDSALDAVLGPNLSYPPPPPDDENE